MSCAKGQLDGRERVRGIAGVEIEGEGGGIIPERTAERGGASQEAC